MIPDSRHDLTTIWDDGTFIRRDWRGRTTHRQLEPQFKQPEAPAPRVDLTEAVEL